tara:strand:+ start:1193 stop:2446 length:1254 start_codon:yes stop_codon:yes gene_type:complete
MFTEKVASIEYSTARGSAGINPSGIAVKPKPLHLQQTNLPMKLRKLKPLNLSTFSEEAVRRYPKGTPEYDALKPHRRVVDSFRKELAAINPNVYFGGKGNPNIDGFGQMAGVAGPTYSTTREDRVQKSIKRRRPMVSVQVKNPQVLAHELGHIQDFKERGFRVTDPEAWKKMVANQTQMGGYGMEGRATQLAAEKIHGKKFDIKNLSPAQRKRLADMLAAQTSYTEIYEGRVKPNMKMREAGMQVKDRLAALKNTPIAKKREAFDKALSQSKPVKRLDRAIEILENRLKKQRSSSSYDWGLNSKDIQKTKDQIDAIKKRRKVAANPFSNRLFEKMTPAQRQDVMGFIDDLTDRTTKRFSKRMGPEMGEQLGRLYREEMIKGLTNPELRGARGAFSSVNKPKLSPDKLVQITRKLLRR